jgi:hypothetical protein
VPDLEQLRRLTPPVEPAPPETVERVRARLVVAASGGRARRRRPLVVAVPLAVGAALAIVVFVTQLGAGHSPAFAAEAVRAAESSPRLLLDGWTVTRVDEWQAGTGEMTFARGGREIEVRWSPWPGEGPSKPGELRVAVTDVLGARAVVRRYDGTDEYTASWRDGKAAVEARGRAYGRDDFVDVLHSFSKTDVQGWLSAMPESAVTPRQHADAVAAMLKGLPIPPGLDVDTLGTNGETRDRYQLGAQVSGAVACGWIAEWLHARAAGDRVAAARAADALATSRSWPILREMQADGAYPDVLWQYADAVRTGGDAPAGKPGMTVARTSNDALGCPP